MPRSPAALWLLGSLLAACDPGQTGPARSPAEPAFNFTAGPSLLPLIVRLETRTLIGWRDFERGLGIIIGAPPEPTTHVLCGGTERAGLLAMQFVGDAATFQDFTGLFKQLAMDPDATVLVYDVLTPTLAESLCDETPVARGTGFYLRTDNDFFGALGRANAFSEHLEARVELAGGGFGRVVARLGGIGRPEGGLLFLETSILLVTGGP